MGYFIELGRLWLLRGPGDLLLGEGQNRVVSGRGECQLPDALNLLKIQVITVHVRTLNANFQKRPFSEFRNLSSPTFFEQSPRNVQDMFQGPF